MGTVIIPNEEAAARFARLLCLEHASSSSCPPIVEALTSSVGNLYLLVCGVLFALTLCRRLRIDHCAAYRGLVQVLWYG